MSIYILRHEKRYSKPSFDTSLTSEGIENTFNLSNLLEKLNINIIYCSPFKRIIQTIEPFLEKTKKKVNIEYSLYEFLHENEFCNEDIKSINNDMYGYEYFNNNYESFYDINNLKYPESRLSLENRVNNFFAHLKKENITKNILLVTHMSPVNVVINKDKRFPYPQGGLSLIYKDKERYEPQNF